MELRESADAAGRCRPAALAALGLLRERGLEAELVRLGLDRKNEHHWIAVVGDIAIDPSARQFKPMPTHRYRASHPLRSTSPSGRNNRYSTPPHLGT
jgi:hypothetical protein